MYIFLVRQGLFSGLRLFTCPGMTASQVGYSDKSSLVFARFVPETLRQEPKNHSILKGRNS